jgi:hypothetical protein
MKDNRDQSDISSNAALARSRAATSKNIVDTGIVVLPVFQMVCLANGHYKTAAAIGSIVVASAFLHNHFLNAAQAPLRSENIALGNFRRLML